MSNATRSPPIDPPIDWTEYRRQTLERTLRRHLQGEVRFAPADRALYGTDASIYQIEPIGVVIPRTQADLLAAVQIALEQHVPLIPRGGGTSLSGQTVGAGLVVDCSKYLHAIVETNLDQRWVKVEPGVVLASLNRHLEPMGFQIGPDVATIDRANIGGMIGNNSAGARSVKYGKMIDHVQALEVILTDGRVTTFEDLQGERLDEKLRHNDREGQIYRTVRKVVFDHQRAIRDRFPKILRRVSGYNLDAMLQAGATNLSRLIVGSEGTLATVATARLGIVPKPRHRGIAVLHFDQLDAALRCVPTILETEPSAVELIDELILKLARENAVYRDRIDFVEGRPAAILLVEYSSDETSAIESALEKLRGVLRGQSVGAVVIQREPRQCDHIWNVRKTAMPLLLSLPGVRKPITFVEDTAVAPHRLAEFVARFKEILHRHGTDGSFYGHASVGCLHIRPLLDLRSFQGVHDMASIARAVVDLVMEFGGALSGEHGDGLARSGFNRELFGDEVYEAFCAIKRVFDPDNLMNPGKIVDAGPLTEHLRPVAQSRTNPETAFSFDADGGMIEVAARCNGNALCRRLTGGVMCPSYVATREEEHSPRGRANLLRAALEGRLDGGRTWPHPHLDRALDLCLMCKACKTECPSSVDIAKLKSEYLHQSYRRRPASPLARMMADFPTHARRASRYAPFSNWVLHSWPARWLMHRWLGIDSRRRLPDYQRITLADWFARHASACRKKLGDVVLLADCFTNFHEPQIGRDAVLLLEAAGYQVHLAPICCGRTMISKGFLDEARQRIRRHLSQLAVYVDDDLPILGIEPSCLLTLTDEWRDLEPGEASTRVAQRSFLVESWLADQARAGATTLPEPVPEPLDVLVHGHCHQKAAGQFSPTVEALRQLAGVTPSVIDSGCCGMAGSFGYEAEHYETSVAIAEQRLLPAVRRGGTTTLVASGFSCRSQLSDLAQRRALHPIELIRQRLPGVVERG